MKYSGVLRALLDSVEGKGRPPKGTLWAQKVGTEAGSSAWIGFDTGGNVHFLLAPSPAKIARIRRFRLKSVTFEKRDWVVPNSVSTSYLDIHCKAIPDSPMIRPFLGFCEDILLELDRKGIRLEDAVYRTCLRWKRFWTMERETEFSQEWLRGLLGELMFLRELVGRFGGRALRTWTGPDDADHDFQGNGHAFEIKTTLKTPMSVTISNLNQLDQTLFKRLHLVCYRLERNDDGQTIVDVVRQVEDMLTGNEGFLEKYLGRLQKAGYSRRLEESYENYRFRVIAPVFFHVDDKFPKITSRSFGAPVDRRVKNIRYSVELVGFKVLGMKTKSVDSSFSTLCGKPGIADG